LPTNLLIGIPLKTTPTIAIEKILTSRTIVLNTTVIEDKYIASQISSQSKITVNLLFNQKLLSGLLKSIVYLLLNYQTFANM